MHRIIIAFFYQFLSAFNELSDCEVGFQLSSFNFTQYETHGFTCFEPCCAHIKWPIFWKLPGLGKSNVNFLIADVTYFVSGTMITFSQGRAIKIKSEHFSEFRSQTSMHKICFNYVVSCSNNTS